MTTLTGICKNCQHDGTKHKGIDPKLRMGSRCTGLQLNEEVSAQRGISVYGPNKCMCDDYQTADH